MRVGPEVGDVTAATSVSGSSERHHIRRSNRSDKRLSCAGFAPKQDELAADELGKQSQSRAMLNDDPGGRREGGRARRGWA